MSALTQNTPAWEEMRKGMIGASDAPIIMGVSPYTTPYQLWEQKIGLAPSPSNTYGKQRGHDLEEPARQKMEEMTGLFFRPMVKFHPTIDWMMCSLDCISLDNEVIGEIKNGKKEDHEKCKLGIIPEKHFPQLQHHMEVCEKESSLYFSFYNDEGVIVKVLRDDKYISSMMKEERRFYAWMQDLEAPPLTNRDYKLRESQEWLDLMSHWQECYATFKEAKEAVNKVRIAAIGMCEGQSSRGGGVFIRKVVEKGRIDYGAIPELQNVNLDVYRKPSIEKWKFSQEKKGE